MMNDLISRQAAISLPVKPKEDRYFQTQNLDDAYDYGWYSLQSCIERLPSAQPTIEPRAKGEWIANEYGAVICSKCNLPAPMIMTGCLVNRHLEYDKSDFCWHCGADMREVTE